MASLGLEGCENERQDAWKLRPVDCREVRPGRRGYRVKLGIRGAFAGTVPAMHDVFLRAVESVEILFFWPSLFDQPE